MTTFVTLPGHAERYRDFDMWAPTHDRNHWSATHKDAEDDGAAVFGKSRADLISEIDEWHADNSWERAELYRLRGALQELSDLFALPGENSLDRFERLAAMFRKDTGYLAPGKDQPMSGTDQPDGDDLRAIYDAWYQAKVDRARSVLASQTTLDPYEQGPFGQRRTV